MSPGVRVSVAQDRHSDGFECLDGLRDQDVLLHNAELVAESNENCYCGVTDLIEVLDQANSFTQVVHGPVGEILTFVDPASRIGHDLGTCSGQEPKRAAAVIRRARCVLLVPSQLPAFVALGGARVLPIQAALVQDQVATGSAVEAICQRHSCSIAHSSSTT